jgi:hypothetical protein
MVGPAGLACALRVNQRAMDYEITSPRREPHGLPGCKPFINLTLTRYGTSRSLIRTGFPMSSGNGKLTRFNQVFGTQLLPVLLNLDNTSSRSQDRKADPKIPLTRVA